MADKDDFDIEAFVADPKNKGKVTFFDKMFDRALDARRKSKLNEKSKGFLDEFFGSDEADD